MKTMKRLLAALLCVCLLTGTLVFSGAAADTQDPTPTPLAEPTVTVTKADGMTVSEMTFDFITDGETAVAPIFTDFDTNAVVDCAAKLTDYSFTAKPLAYDAQNGLLTVALYDKSGAPGVKMAKVCEEIGKDVEPITEEMSGYANALLGEILEYTFTFPQGLLKGSNAASERAEFSFFSHRIQNIPSLNVKIFGQTYYQVWNRVYRTVNDFAAKLSSGKETLLSKAVNTLVSDYFAALRDMGQFRFSFKTLLLIPFMFFDIPMTIPVMIRYSRAVKEAKGIYAD